MDGSWKEESVDNYTLGMRLCYVRIYSVVQLPVMFQTRSSDSPITRIFGGKFRSTLKAPHQKDSVTVEDWRSLRLDIQVWCLRLRLNECLHAQRLVFFQREQVHTIKDALQFISHPHSVEITTPTRPGVVIEAQRQELIEALPPVLILHLKRFLYDTSVGDVVKIGKHVTFGPDLEIGPGRLSGIPFLDVGTHDCCRLAFAYTSDIAASEVPAVRW